MLRVVVVSDSHDNGPMDEVEHIRDIPAVHNDLIGEAVSIRIEENDGGSNKGGCNPEQAELKFLCV